MRDLSFCSRICHRFLAFCYALIIAISFDAQPFNPGRQPAC
jgi:hypothetical protein